LNKKIAILIALTLVAVGFYEGYSYYGFFETAFFSSMGFGLFLAFATSNKKHRNSK
jgi:hypothetical protein